MKWIKCVSTFSPCLPQKSKLTILMHSASSIVEIGPNRRSRTSGLRCPRGFRRRLVAKWEPLGASCWEVKQGIAKFEEATDSTKALSKEDSATIADNWRRTFCTRRSRTSTVQRLFSISPMVPECSGHVSGVRRRFGNDFNGSIVGRGQERAH